MAGKKWSSGTGPRPASLPSSVYEDIADPANGEAVRRCFECGVPATTETVLEFGLTLHGKPVGRYRLCERDFIRRNPRDPRDGDPLRAA